MDLISKGFAIDALGMVWWVVCLVGLSLMLLPVASILLSIRKGGR